MTTKLGTLNDLALPPPETDTAANSSSRYKPRRQVSHEDGPDATFWNTSYFIPGISGPARCLEDARDGILENNKPKTRRKPKTSNESAVTSVSRSSLIWYEESTGRNPCQLKATRTRRHGRWIRRRRHNRRNPTTKRGHVRPYQMTLYRQATKMNQMKRIPFCHNEAIV